MGLGAVAAADWRGMVPVFCLGPVRTSLVGFQAFQRDNDAHFRCPEPACPEGDVSFG